MALMLDVLLIVLVVVAIAALGVLIWVLVRAADALTSVKRFADDGDRTLVPLAEKADATLDLVNAEVLRIDMIVEQVSEIVDRVDATRRAAETTVDSAVGGASRFGKAVASVFKSSGSKRAPGATDAEEADFIVTGDGVAYETAADDEFDQAAQPRWSDLTDEDSRGAGDEAPSASTQGEPR